MTKNNGCKSQEFSLEPEHTPLYEWTLECDVISDCERVEQVIMLTDLVSHSHSRDVKHNGEWCQTNNELIGVLRKRQFVVGEKWTEDTADFFHIWS